MKYNVGDVVTCNTETPVNKQKRIVVKIPSVDSVLGSGHFQIVSKDETNQTYKVIIENDMLGWDISMFHIQHEKVPVAFNGKKFYDVPEIFILGKYK